MVIEIDKKAFTIQTFYKQPIIKNIIKPYPKGKERFIFQIDAGCLLICKS